jgi:hypothetical protein
MADVSPTSVARASGNETLEMCEAVIAWAKQRRPGVRALRELVLGDRRIDLVFVDERDVFGVELKSSRDRLDRLEAQMLEYSRYLPEVWIAIAPKWQAEVEEMYGLRANRLIVENGTARTLIKYQERIGDSGRRPQRDELSIMRLLELLWTGEAARIAERTGIIPGCTHSKQMTAPKIKKMLARLMTGNEILEQVCRELRSRPLVGMHSDPPMRGESAAACEG